MYKARDKFIKHLNTRIIGINEFNKISNFVPNIFYDKGIFKKKLLVL